MRDEAACKSSKTEIRITVKWKCSLCRLILYSKINLNPEFYTEFFSFGGILKASLSQKKTWIWPSNIYTYNSNRNISVWLSTLLLAKCCTKLPWYSQLKKRKQEKVCKAEEWCCITKILKTTSQAWQNWSEKAVFPSLTEGDPDTAVSL